MSSWPASTVSCGPVDEPDGASVLNILQRIFGPFFEVLVREGLRDQVFLAITVACGFLLVVSVVFAVAVLAHRYGQERRDRHRAQLRRTMGPLILDVLAGDAPEETVQARVARRDRIDFIDLLLEYAQTLRGEELEGVRQLARPHLDLVVRRALHPVAERRAKAIRSLSTLALIDHEDVILRALDDPSPPVALLAAQALAARGGARHARAILDRLPRFELWSPGYLSEMIASMGAEVFPHLQSICSDYGISPAARAVAADAIRQIGVPEGADLAIELLARASEVERPEEREIVLASLRILAEVGRPEHLAVARRLADDPDPVVRALATSAVGELGGPDDVPRLVRAVGDPSRWVAVHAARALRSMRAVQALERLAGAEGGERAELAREVLAG